VTHNDPIPTCDGACLDCDIECPHRTHVATTTWTSGPAYVSPMKLDLGHSTEQQQEGS
jgi:hypothetical protein